MTEHLELARRVLPHRLTLKMLPRPAAEVYLDRHLPDLEGEEREYALSFAGQNIPERTPRPQDPLFCAAMFLAGVSLGDLSKLMGVTKQTIHQKVCRRLNHVERQQRDTLQYLDLEVLALCRQTFNEALQVAPGCFDGVYPVTIGRGLLSSATAIVAEDRGEEPATQRPRRYSNMNTSQGKEADARLIGQLDLSEIVPATKLTNIQMDGAMVANKRLIAEQLPEAGPDDQPPACIPTAPVVRPEEQSFLDTL